MEGWEGRKPGKSQATMGVPSPTCKTHTQYAPWEGLTERCERTRIVDSFCYESVSSCHTMDRIEKLSQEEEYTFSCAVQKPARFKISQQSVSS